ncbi:alcohol dehydrogenase catalytic domain-containing protein [Mucilaginibacter lappiensis]|uniref:NADPH:quinone reductase-like Zn-dependent oxidoreductase n=1 Tax=Mucilaginibacter lappiensis TaxID=354630 RepID=A0A841JHF4_9SPHI|nr:alcohol dehydrogenase catalytic domain-containing protein [Mucilaginibacter lappiensis]MBB6130603.1 NADPH:quinone reductase-like Zn-dependent oxidoreductase [Mucilaginibacter lappiensis]
MKEIRIYEFGGPEVMKIVEVEIPVPQADEILVKMFASGINPADYVVRQGGNEILKPFLKLPLGLGLDGAGTIEEIGSEVTGLKKGDHLQVNMEKILQNRWVMLTKKSVALISLKGHLLVQMQWIKQIKP